MKLILLIGLALVGAQVPGIAASRVNFSGRESAQEALALLRATGNELSVDPAALKAPVAFPPGQRTFWQAVDEWCRQSNLVVQWRGDRLHLVPLDKFRGVVVNDGPVRIALKQMSSSLYPDQPELNRLSVLLEVSTEPKLLPVLWELRPASVKIEPSPGNGSDAQEPGKLAYRFDNGRTREFEVRFPRPPRSLQKLQSLSLQGTLWVAKELLEFDLPLQAGADHRKPQASCKIAAVDVDVASATWEVTAILTYPPMSLEWESNQANLLANVSLELFKNGQKHPSIGRQVRADAGRQLEIRWLLRNVPGQPEGWRARIRAPSAPLPHEVKIKFTEVALP